MPYMMQRLMRTLSGSTPWNATRSSPEFQIISNQRITSKVFRKVLLFLWFVLFVHAAYEHPLHFKAIYFEMIIEEDTTIMNVLDSLDTQLGKGTIKLSQDGSRRSWKMRQERKLPEWFADLPMKSTYSCGYSSVFKSLIQVITTRTSLTGFAYCCRGWLIRSMTQKI